MENARKATLAKYERLLPGNNTKQISTAAITEDLDEGVGVVLKAIDRLALADNTYVIYMANNGAGGQKKGGLSGGKGGVWEGGRRVPFIVRGLGIKPNSWYHVRVVGYDLFPTFCEWAGISPSQLPPGLEGGSIAGLLAHGGQEEVKRPRRELGFHFPHYQSGDGPQSAILLGNFKLMHFYEDNRDELFELANDLGERNDLAAKLPDEVKQLRAKLDSFLRAINAQFPESNPQYDPSRPAASIEPGGKKRKPKP